MIPAKAFILAAGHGKRLRPYTDARPKPLVEIGGRSLLDRTLDALSAIGVQQAVINTHYLGEQIPAALTGRKAPELVFSHEDVLLDTGGGIKKMLQHFSTPFYVLSGDGLWQDDPAAPALPTLAKAWDPSKMDILILLQPISTMKLTQGIGDYDLEPQGQAKRAKDKSGAYMFTSMHINAPGIFRDAPDGPFSYLELLDRAEAAGRLYGIVHSGNWHHISTPADLESVRAAWDEA